VARELAGRSAAATAGERQFQQLGLTGARGEAESGFATVRRVLPQWNGRQLHDLLLRLMAVNPDSNLVSRGGIHGLRYVQSYARTLLANGWDRGVTGDGQGADKASFKPGWECGFTVGGVGFSEVRLMSLPEERGGTIG
jgi:triphosphoribosyl-dephospho-CoA synthetase